MEKYHFVDFEFPKTQDQKFFAVLDDAGMLRSRREQLGLTMLQVAEMAGVQFSQYQKLESGERTLSACSMRIGLSICAVLMLDPLKMVGIAVKQMDKGELKPQMSIGFNQGSVVTGKVGRKQIRRDIMSVYANYRNYAFVIPYEIFDHIGSPNYFKLLWRAEDRSLVIWPTEKKENDTYFVSPINGPANFVFSEVRHIPDPVFCDERYRFPMEIETKLVRDKHGKLAAFVDLKKTRLFTGFLCHTFVPCGPDMDDLQNDTTEDEIDMNDDNEN